MSIFMKPTGNVISGHVLDVNKKSFQGALQAYDPQLYVRWNPKKVKGWGCWEIRRKPEFTTIRDFAEFEGNVIVHVDYVEDNFACHIMDCAFLNYDQLRKLKEIDTWQVGTKQWLNNLEYNEGKQKEIRAEMAQKARKYAANYFRPQIQAFKDYVLSGGNPHLIGALWDSVKESE